MTLNPMAASGPDHDAVPTEHEADDAHMASLTSKELHALFVRNRGDDVRKHAAPVDPRYRPNLVIRLAQKFRRPQHLDVQSEDAGPDD